jgi:hypothetical protein
VLICEEEDIGCIKNQGTCDGFEDKSLSIPCETIGPPPLGPSILINKEKTIQDFVTVEGVGLTFPHLLKGGTFVGPKNNLLYLELCMVDKIKDKEVVFLAWQESNFVCSNPCENIPFWRLILNRRRRLTKVERNRWWLLEG